MIDFFDDIQVGARTEVGSHTFNADEIKAFARRFDPQRFHLDENEAAQTHFGALVASGWHTAAVWMRLTVDCRKREIDAIRARGHPVPQTGPALGFRDLKWIKPVFVGDTISFSTEVIAARPSNSRPRYGLMSTRTEAINQRGETVMSFTSTTFVERRAIS